MGEKRPQPRRPDDYTPEPKALPQDAQDAMSVAGDIEYYVTQKLDKETIAKAAGFFRDVRRKADDIAQTVKKHGRVTVGQRRALDNMLAGIKKWDHEHDEDEDEDED